MMGSVLCKLISFHSVDINGRKNVSYYVKGLVYCTNICEGIYVIVLHIDMQGDIKHMQGDTFYCIAYRYAKGYKHMQGEIFYCIAYSYANRYKLIKGDILYCIAFMYARRCKLLY